MAEGDPLLRARVGPAVLSVGVAAVLLLTAAAASALTPASPANQLVPQNVADQARRSVVWIGFPAGSPSAFRIDSASVGAPSPDEFQISYSHGAFSLDYEQTAGGPITSRFTVGVQGLVEWLPSGDGLFSDGTVVAYTPMGASAFGGVPVEHIQMTTSDGVVVHTFIIRSNSGELTLNLTISQGFVKLPSGSMLTPMEAELTLHLNHLMGQMDTHLAVQLNLSTDQHIALQNGSWDEEHLFSQDQHSINITNDALPIASTAFFSWSGHADVNGQSSGVTVGGPVMNETSGGYDLYLSYPRVAAPMNPDEMEVVHDPSLGIVSAAYESIPTHVPVTGIQADPPLYVGSMAAVAALVGGTVLLARRQRRERP